MEQALMSAADFVQNTADLMYLGGFLAQEGYDRRALQIFEQVSKLEPLWPEPYMHGMKLAKKLDDLDGLQWSTVGILSQAWPTDQAVIEESANRVAKATLASLRSTSRNAEADAFQKQMDAANQARLRGARAMDGRGRHRLDDQGASRYRLLVEQ